MVNRIDQFRALHVPGDPLVLFNIWDAGSARAVADAGAKAIATGSHGVAEANGFKDGESLPFHVVLDNLRRILSVTDLPVTLDTEAGYGDTPEKVALAVGKVFDLGAVGINIEDRMPGASNLIPVKEAAERISAAAGTGIHVNARTDVYMGQKPEEYALALVTEVISRAKRFADAGAGSLFVPFLRDHATIRQICEASPLPINVMWGPGSGTHEELAALDVARISYGPGPWAAAMEWLGQQAAAVFAQGIVPYAEPT